MTKKDRLVIDNPTLPQLSKIAEQFKGKGGNEEAESILVDCNADKEKNIVTVYSCKADAAKIIERCGRNIKKVTLTGSGVNLEIDRRAFRGLQCAFRGAKD